MRLIGDAIFANSIVLKRDKKNSFVHIEQEEEKLEKWMSIEINGFSDIENEER